MRREGEQAIVAPFSTAVRRRDEVHGSRVNKAIRSLLDTG